MSPAIVLLFCLSGITLLNLLGPAWLVVAVMGCVFAGFRLARARTLRLVLRCRILLAAIFILFAWFTPGEALFVSWPAAGPSHEGMALALVHGGRLLGALCLVAVLLERLPAPSLVGAFYTLCSPLSALGVAVDRLALRLLLVLRYADEVGGGYESLRRWLAQDDFSCEPVLLRRDPLGRKEKMMAAGMLAALCAVWYFP